MSRRVLVVDDDPDILRLCRKCLEDTWTVTVARSSSEALERVTRDEPEILLLDVMMPGTDGLETLARLREHDETAELPVVLMTAAATARDAAKYRALGAAGVIPKPFDPTTLTDELERLVRRE